jgi:hypothetical protein
MRWLILLMMLLVSACGLLGSGATMEDCEQVGVRYTAPDYVTVNTESCVLGSGPGNAQYRTVLNITPENLAQFQESTGLTEWSTDLTGADIFEEEAEQPLSGLLATYGDGAYMREVLIDTSDPAEYTVYYYHAFVD